MNKRKIIFLCLLLFFQTQTGLKNLNFNDKFKVGGLSVLALYFGYDLSKKIKKLPEWHSGVKNQEPGHSWKIVGKKLAPVFFDGAAMGVFLFLIYKILNESSKEAALEAALREKWKS